MPARDVDANGTRLRVVDEGQGPAVLLVHGFPETAHAWRHQIRALAEAGYRAIAPDLRGYGGSERPEAAESYSVFDIVGDLVGLLDALAIDEAVIVGNDWGATIAWQAALMRPDRFRAIVAIGVPMMGPAPMRPTQLFPQNEEALFYTLYFQEPGVAEAEFERDVTLTLRKLLFAASRDAGPRRPGDGTPNPFSMVSRPLGLLGGLPDPAELPAWLTEDDLRTYAAAFAESGFRGPLSYYRNLDANWRLQRSLAGLKVEVPAFYMVGEQDVGLEMPGMREIIAAMPALVPQLGGSVFIPDCGHWAPQERPDVVSGNILEFVGTL